MERGPHCSARDGFSQKVAQTGRLYAVCCQAFGKTGHQQNGQIWAYAQELARYGHARYPGHRLIQQNK